MKDGHAKPDILPTNPSFSSGPCAKHPSWKLERLAPFVGRSHRSIAGRSRLRHAIELTGEVLQVPSNYRIAIVPASDTGAMEMALWSLLGARPVTLAVWEHFGAVWAQDVCEQIV